MNNYVISILNTNIQGAIFHIRLLHAVPVLRVLLEINFNTLPLDYCFQGHSNNFYCGSSSWKAATNTVNRQSKLDETGLVVAGCRHSLA